MYAIIRTGGKQYRVAPNDIIKIEKLDGAAGDTVAFEDVLMVGGDSPQVGSPLVSGASVAGEVVDQMRAAKVLVFKKKRRQNYRRTHGHRQHLTLVRITDILTGGKKVATKTAEARPVEKAEPKRAEAKPADEKKSEKKAEKPAEKKTEKKADKPAEKKSDAKKEFQPLKKPEGEPDDLKKISGVGPKIEEKLNGMGIFHYWQVAAFRKADIDRIDDELSFAGRIERDDWVAQAKKLMKG